MTMARDFQLMDGLGSVIGGWRSSISLIAAPSPWQARTERSLRDHAQSGKDGVYRIRVHEWLMKDGMTISKRFLRGWAMRFMLIHRQNKRKASIGRMTLVRSRG
jgi:hypothetical protein